MSRIGRLPVAIPEKVSVTIENGVITVKGPMGTLSQAIENKRISVVVENNQIAVTRLSEDKAVKAAHGLYRALIQNMVIGVTKGYEKALIINGVGYKSSVVGNKLVLNVGYSHPVEIEAPEGIKIECASLTEVVVKGISKELVGQVAADIKAVRKPEPYHGYGIRYKDETIIRKEGKTAGK